MFIPLGQKYRGGTYLSTPGAAHRPGYECRRCRTPYARRKISRKPSSASVETSLGPSASRRRRPPPRGVAGRVPRPAHTRSPSAPRPSRTPGCRTARRSTAAPAPDHRTPRSPPTTTVVPWISPFTLRLPNSTTTRPVTSPSTCTEQKMQVAFMDHLPLRHKQVLVEVRTIHRRRRLRTRLRSCLQQRKSTQQQGSSTHAQGLEASLASRSPSSIRPHALLRPDTCSVRAACAIGSLAAPLPGAVRLHHPPHHPHQQPDHPSNNQQRRQHDREPQAARQHRPVTAYMRTLRQTRRAEDRRQIAINPRIVSEHQGRKQRRNIARDRPPVQNRHRTEEHRNVPMHIAIHPNRARTCRPHPPRDDPPR